MMQFKECYSPSQGGVTSPSFSRGSLKFMRYCGRICRRLPGMDQKDSFPGVLKKRRICDVGENVLFSSSYVIPLCCVSEITLVSG